jgi:hypothetical protein
MKGISGDKFVLLFSEFPFPGCDVITWVKEDGSGNVYCWNNMEGWLCSALLNYFYEPPKQIYIKVQAHET